MTKLFNGLKGKLYVCHSGGLETSGLGTRRSRSVTVQRASISVRRHSSNSFTGCKYDVKFTLWNSHCEYIKVIPHLWAIISSESKSMMSHYGWASDWPSRLDGPHLVATKLAPRLHFHDKCRLSMASRYSRQIECQVDDSLVLSLFLVSLYRAIHLSTNSTTILTRTRIERIGSFKATDRWWFISDEAQYIGRMWLSDRTFQWSDSENRIKCKLHNE